MKKSKILQILTLGRRRLHNNIYYYYGNALLSLSVLNLSRMCMISAEFVEITLGIEVRHNLPVVTGWLLTVFGVLQMGFGETVVVLIFGLLLIWRHDSTWLSNFRCAKLNL